MQGQTATGGLAWKGERTSVQRMGRGVKRVIGWCHLYAGTLLAFEHPVAGVLLALIGFAWWMEPRR